MTIGYGSLGRIPGTIVHHVHRFFGSTAVREWAIVVFDKQIERLLFRCSTWCLNVASCLSWRRYSTPGTIPAQTRWHDSCIIASRSILVSASGLDPGAREKTGQKRKTQGNRTNNIQHQSPYCRLFLRCLVIGLRSVIDLCIVVLTLWYPEVAANDVPALVAIVPCVTEFLI